MFVFFAGTKKTNIKKVNQLYMKKCMNNGFYTSAVRLP